MQPANYQFPPGPGNPNIHPYGNQVYMMSVPQQGIPQHQMAYGAQRGMADAGPMIYPGQPPSVVYAPAQPMPSAGQRTVQPMMVQLPPQFVNSQQMPMQQGVSYHGAAHQWQNSQQSYNAGVQQTQSFHTAQQQPFKKSSEPRSFPFPGQSMSQSTHPPPSAERSDSAKRHANRLTFTDPNTGENVVFGQPKSAQKPAVAMATAVADTVRDQSPANTNVVAAEFAAKVAATLNTPQSAGADPKIPADRSVPVISQSSDSPAGIELKQEVPQHPPGAPQDLRDSDVLDSKHTAASITPVSVADTTTPISFETSTVSTVPETATVLAAVETSAALETPPAVETVVASTSPETVPETPVSETVAVKSDPTPSTDISPPSKSEDVATTTVATATVASDSLPEPSPSAVAKPPQSAAAKKDESAGKDTKKKKVPTATLR